MSASEKNYEMAGDDKIVPFHVAPLEVRGRAVQLGPVLDAILKRHNYPAHVCRVLGEMVVLTVLLGTSLKFSGKFIVQAQSDGPVSLLVVELETPGNIRAYARYDKTAIAEMDAAAQSRPETLLGKGVLAMTIDQGSQSQRYQGIVELDGSSLEEIAHKYFMQSEQIPTKLRLAVAETLSPAKKGEKAQSGSRHGWRAGGVLVQFLPEDETRLTLRDLPGGDGALEDEAQNEVFERDDLWVEAVAMVETIGDDELTDPMINCERLLYRLFHERGVHVFDGPKIGEYCSCSRQKILSILASLDKDDLDQSWQDDQITSLCEFCGTLYRLPREEVEAGRKDFV